MLFNTVRPDGVPGNREMVILPPKHVKVVNWHRHMGFRLLADVLGSGGLCRKKNAITPRLMMNFRLHADALSTGGLCKSRLLTCR